MNQETQKLFEKYQKREERADFAKLFGIWIVAGSTAILSIPGTAAGGLVYAVGCLYNRKYRHAREDILKGELENKVHEDVQCENCRYKTRM